jgi:hypothetical protein|tara:strand:+ start:2734 stop:3690 length:957 start_codon:yes stop_codon:yes gene_type:complete
MATSNSSDFNLTRNQIIEESFREIGVKTPNRTLTSEEMNDGARTLNLLVKSLIAKGSFLWKIKQATLFLVTGQSQYVIDGTTANCAESFNETTITADALLGASSIDVTDTTGFVIGYNIGVLQDDNSILWTTITSIATLTIGLNTPLTAQASSGSSVYVYETKVKRPENIQNAQSNDSSNNDIPMVTYSRDSYYNLPVKNTSGRPNLFYYDKQLTAGLVNLWPVPSTSKQKIIFSYTKTIEDFDQALNDPDFPVEWLQPVILNVAYRLSRKYGRLDLQGKEQLKRDADDALAEAEGYDREDTSFYFQPATNINVNSYR